MPQPNHNTNTQINELISELEGGERFWCGVGRIKQKKGSQPNILKPGCSFFCLWFKSSPAGAAVLPLLPFPVGEVEGVSVAVGDAVEGLRFLSSACVYFLF